MDQGHVNEMVALGNVRNEGREAVALWMMKAGYATGHGDTVEDLLAELERQAKDEGAGDQARREEDHYQAAMTMSEKHRKLWVEASQEAKRLREIIGNLVKIAPRPWMDGGASWAEWDAAMTAAEAAISVAGEPGAEIATEARRRDNDERAP